MKIIIVLLMISSSCFAQVGGPEFEKIDRQLDSLEQLKKELNLQLESIRFSWMKDEIATIGLPENDNEQEIIAHSAMTISYNEFHEQANWVMHIILPAIEEGNVSRTNDFREDPLVTTGSAQEIDYFLKTLKEDSTYKYDGFGYDRGHLAPSADFRWSATALSESYFYSNMSPQVGALNREKWAQLEGNLRGYVIRNKAPLAVVTAPVLNENLEKIERSSNGLTIPKLYVKAVYDKKNQRGIAYVLPNEECTKPIEAYAVSIDSAESLLGYDLFPKIENELQAKIESEVDYQSWLPLSQADDVVAIDRKRLPKNGLNTEGVHVFIGNDKKRTVCGKVVSTKKHAKGHVFIDLDKKFPNQVFSVTIFESSVPNFEYQPEIYLMDEEVCFTGLVTEYNGTPSMVIEHGKQVRLLSEYRK